jgi:hypothetical protein
MPLQVRDYREFLDLLTRRVRHLSGKRQQAQAEIEAYAAAEQQFARQHNSRVRWSWGRAAVVGGLLAPPLLFTGGPVVAAAAGLWAQVANPWTRHDQEWARRVGPKIREMRSAMARIEEIRTLPVPQTPVLARERQTITEQLERATAEMRAAVRLLDGWRRLPAFEHDRLNAGLSQRFWRIWLGATVPWAIVWPRAGRGAADVAAGATTAIVATAEEDVAGQVHEATRPPVVDDPGGGPGAAPGSGGLIVGALILLGLGLTVAYAVKKLSEEEES